MEWGTPVRWGKFLLFCVPRSVKTKVTYPTRPGSPTPCKQAHKRCSILSPIGGFHAISGDTNNNGEINKFWWTNKES